MICYQVVLSAQDKGHKKHQLNIVSYYFNDEYYYCSKHLYILGTLHSIGESSMQQYLKNNIMPHLHESIIMQLPVHTNECFMKNQTAKAIKAMRVALDDTVEE